MPEHPDETMDVPDSELPSDEQEFAAPPDPDCRATPDIPEDNHVDA